VADTGCLGKDLRRNGESRIGRCLACSSLSAGRKKKGKRGGKKGRKEGEGGGNIGQFTVVFLYAWAPINNTAESEKGGGEREEKKE